MPVESWLLHGVWDYVATEMEGEQLVEEGATPEMLDAWSEQSVDSGRTLDWTGTNPNAIMADLLREVVGPVLFRPLPPLKPAWLTWHDALLVSMARQMYDSRDFSDMPVLGDALENAGCQDQDILGHCRSGGEHVRGCWVVDLLLGKE
jgi:hypothetical protein